MLNYLDITKHRHRLPIPMLLTNRRLRRFRVGLLLVASVLQSCASTESLYAEYDLRSCEVSITSSESGQTIITETLGDEVSVWEPVIFFDYKKIDLRPAGLLALDNDLSVLQKYPELRVAVSGSADARGGDIYNLELSRQRVDSVVEYLTANGLARSRIDTVAVGARKAGALDLSEQAHAIYRRAELVLLDADGKPLTEGLEVSVFDTRLNKLEDEKK